MPESSVRKVYVGHDLDVAVFKEDDNGEPVGISSPDVWVPGSDSPLFTYLFFENATISAQIEQDRRPSTGDKFKKLVTQEYLYSLHVNHLYFLRKEFDAADLFNRKSRFRIYMRQANGFTEDQEILLHATASSFEKKADGDNGISSGSAVFEAEERATWHPAS